MNEKLKNQNVNDEDIEQKIFSEYSFGRDHGVEEDRTFCLFNSDYCPQEGRCTGYDCGNERHVEKECYCDSEETEDGTRRRSYSTEDCPVVESCGGDDNDCSSQCKIEGDEARWY